MLSRGFFPDFFPLAELSIDISLDLREHHGNGNEERIKNDRERVRKKIQDIEIYVWPSEDYTV